MNIIIFYQHKVREIESCKKLKKQIEILLDSDSAIVKIFQIDFEWSRSIKWARKYGIDVVLMPWLYNDYNYALTTPFSKINPSVVIINLHHEQVTSPAYEPVLLPSSLHSKEGCIHFCWGPYFAERLAGNGVPTELIRITGNIRLVIPDRSRKEALRTQLSSEFQLDGNKTWLLYAENRGWIYGLNKSKIEEFKGQGVDRKTVLEYYNICMQSLELTYDQINLLPDSFYERFELVYRPHPGTTSPLHPRRGLHVISSYPISDWLACVDAAIVWSSTSAFEAELASVPVFRHDSIPYPAEFQVAGLSEYESIQNIQDISQNRIEEVFNRQARLKTYLRYYGTVNGNEIEQTAKAVLEIVNEKPNLNRHLEMTHEITRMIKTKWLFELAVKMICKLKLLEKTKWPRSAYNFRLDIPDSIMNTKLLCFHEKRKNF